MLQAASPVLAELEIIVLDWLGESTCVPKMKDQSILSIMSITIIACEY